MYIIEKMSEMVYVEEIQPKSPAIHADLRIVSLDYPFGFCPSFKILIFFHFFQFISNN